MLKAIFWGNLLALIYGLPWTSFSCLSRFGRLHSCHPLLRRLPVSSQHPSFFFRSNCVRCHRSITYKLFAYITTFLCNPPPFPTIPPNQFYPIPRPMHLCGRVKFLYPVSLHVHITVLGVEVDSCFNPCFSSGGAVPMLSTMVFIIIPLPLSFYPATAIQALQSMPFSFSSQVELSTFLS